VKLPPKLVQYAERVDAMTLRERLLIFMAVLVVLVAALNVALIDPLLTRQAALVKRLDEQQARISSLQAQMAAQRKARSEAGNAAARKAAQLAELRAKLDALSQDLERRKSGLVPPERMNAVVAEIVRRNQGVQLVSLKSLPTTEITSGGSGSGLYRHGTEITVSGGYQDLVSYLNDLERMPAKVSWGRLDLDASSYPRLTLTLVLNTLGTGKPWMQI